MLFPDKCGGLVPVKFLENRNLLIDGMGRYVKFVPCIFPSLLCFISQVFHFSVCVFVMCFSALVFCSMFWFRNGSKMTSNNKNKLVN